MCLVLFHSDFSPYMFLNVSFKFLTISWTLVRLTSKTQVFVFVFSFGVVAVLLSLVSGVEEYCIRGDVVVTCFLTYCVSFFVCLT